MAVAKSRKSRSRRNMRRHANSALVPPALSIDPATGVMHLRHRVGPDGYYKGRQVVAIKAMSHGAEEEKDEE